MDQDLTDAQRRAWRRRHARRILTIVLSAMACIALVAGYVIADGNDLVGGILTFSNSEAHTFAAARKVRTGAPIVAHADDARAVDPTRAAALVQRLRDDDAVGEGLSVAIAQSDGTVVASHAAGTAREPASTMKTLTSLAAASVLDMGATLDTDTLLVQGTDGTNMVILKGNGDMLLSAGESDPDHVNGRAGLATLAADTAQALRQRGIDTVTLAYDDSLFGDSRYPDGITDIDPDSVYYTGVSSMAVDGGRQRSQALADPDTFEDYPTLSQQTALDTASTFRSLLADQGITVQAGTPNQVHAPEERTALARVSSAPLSAVMAFMLRHSDNTLAEEFGRLLALHQGTGNSPKGATEAVRARLAQLGVDTTGLAMADCSGLTPGSRLTVTTLVQVQQRNLLTGIAPAAAEGLSVAGLMGTARSRLETASASGLMRVKTGSLSTVTSMAGNVSRTKGGTLAFAVIVNDPADLDGARTAIDRFIADLTAL